MFIFNNSYWKINKILLCLLKLYLTSYFICFFILPFVVLCVLWRFGVYKCLTPLPIIFPVISGLSVVFGRFFNYPMYSMLFGLLAPKVFKLFVFPIFLPWVKVFQRHVMHTNLDICVLLVDDPGGNQRPVVRHWQTLLRNLYRIRLSTDGDRNLIIVDTDFMGRCKCNYHVIRATMTLRVY